MPDRTYDRSNGEIRWGDEIPFEDGLSPSAAPVAYQWLLDSGVPAAEARFRVYGWPRTGYTRPLVGANKRRQAFSATFDADDGYNPAVVADEWQPAQATINYVMSLQ